MTATSETVVVFITLVGAYLFLGSDAVSSKLNGFTSISSISIVPNGYLALIETDLVSFSSSCLTSEITNRPGFAAYC